jgi:broad specificity phosphatase PhoE
MDAFVVRHAKAGSRRRFDGDDMLRPLSRPGLRQAEGITELLARSDITRVVSSPYTRCVQTVEPLSTKLGLEVELDEELAEGHDKTLVEHAKAPIALCSHGDVIGDLLHHLAERGVALDDDRYEKGSIWVLQVEDGKVVKGHYLPPPA